MPLQTGYGNRKKLTLPTAKAGGECQSFTFYDDGAHLSDENLRIANECMNAWKSEREGNYVGAHVPGEGVYIRFVGDRNRAIEVTAERGGDALVW